jgi:hypothetical protein
MSVAVITGTSNLNPLEVDVAKVAVVELDPRTRHLRAGHSATGA